MVPPLTDDQYAVLATDILVRHEGEFAHEVTALADVAIADAYNLDADPPFWVWRTSVPRRDILYSVSSASTVFTFVGNGFITRTVQELLAWQELFDPVNDTTNPSLPQVQQALQDIFSGTGNAQQNRMHIAHIARRLATRAERLYATGTGTPGSPGLLVTEGLMDYRAIAKSLRGVPV